MESTDLFYEIQRHLLEDNIPSEYLNKIKDEGILDVEPFFKLKGLEKIDQAPKHHPEGNVWIHTMMVVDQGAKVRSEAKDKEVFMWSLFLHDIGKIKATKMRKGRLTSYDHDKIGEHEVVEFLKNFNLNEEFINKVSKLVRYHMHLLYIMKDMPYGDLKGLLENVDINDISLVFLSDRLGRGGLGKKDKDETINEVNNFRKRYLKENR